jgi:hypothetical protein
MSADTFLLLLTIVCEIAITISVLFILVNWYINFHRKEDLPFTKFIPYLICEFVKETHHYLPQGPDDYVENGYRYKVCSRCDKVRRFWNTRKVVTDGRIFEEDD